MIDNKNSFILFWKFKIWFSITFFSLIQLFLFLNKKILKRILSKLKKLIWCLEKFNLMLLKKISVMILFLCTIFLLQLSQYYFLIWICLLIIVESYFIYFLNKFLLKYFQEKKNLKMWNLLWFKFRKHFIYFILILWFQKCYFFLSKFKRKKIVKSIGRFYGSIFSTQTIYSLWFGRLKNFYWTQLKFNL